MTVESPLLRLSIRRDNDLRSIEFGLSWKSLGLFFWIACGIILLYETLKVWLLLLLLPRQERSRRVTLLLWGISTSYGIFYSFELVFLYVNDEWYPLLPVQLLFTLSDVLTWIVLVCGVHMGRSMAAAGTRPANDNGVDAADSSPLPLFVRKQGLVKTQTLTMTMIWIACSLKLSHIIFNLAVESNYWMARHWLFLCEDTTYLYLVWSDLKLRQRCWATNRKSGLLLVATSCGWLVLGMIVVQLVGVPHRWT